MRPMISLLILFLLIPAVLHGQKVFEVAYESQADLKIYFVQYESQAGWEDEEKQNLLCGYPLE